MAEVINAKQVRYPADQIAQLLVGIDRVISIRGQQISNFKPGSWKPAPCPELLAALLGPTGNLRAPNLKLGRTWFVGFSSDVYRKQFACG